MTFVPEFYASRPNVIKFRRMIAAKTQRQSSQDDGERLLDAALRDFVAAWVDAPQCPPEPESQHEGVN